MISSFRFSVVFRREPGASAGLMAGIYHGQGGMSCDSLEILEKRPDGNGASGVKAEKNGEKSSRNTGTQAGAGRREQPRMGANQRE
jgi:hypothetical protein